MADDSGSKTIVDPALEARQAGLTYVSTETAGLARRRAGKGFAYTGPDRQPINDPDVVRRVKALAVPPAWRDVWICPTPDGHIQAVGYDSHVYGFGLIQSSIIVIYGALTRRGFFVGSIDESSSSRSTKLNATELSATPKGMNRRRPWAMAPQV